MTIYNSKAERKFKQCLNNKFTHHQQPGNINEFLKRHNLDHLSTAFIDNGTDLDFAKELTSDEMKEFGIASAKDRIKLFRAFKTL